MSEEKADYNPADKMIKLSGKAYLQVADRIVWFRNDYPEGTIETSVVSIDEERGSAVFRARITTGQGGVAEATGSETLKDFPQGWIEKAESKAVGRALGYLGYGTAAAGFEEGRRVVDAPQEIRQNDKVKYSDPRHAAPYSPRQAVREELAAREATPLTEKEFDQCIESAWELMENGSTFDAIKTFLNEHRPRMNEEQRIVARQQVTALETAVSERDAVTAPAAAPAAPPH